MMFLLLLGDRSPSYDSPVLLLRRRGRSLSDMGVKLLLGTRENRVNCFADRGLRLSNEGGRLKA